MTICNRQHSQYLARSYLKLEHLENERNLSPSNEIYFCANKAELLNDSGHYLCWSSEYLAGLAACLDKGERGIYTYKT